MIGYKPYFNYELKGRPFELLEEALASWQRTYSKPSPKRLILNEILEADIGESYEGIPIEYWTGGILGCEVYMTDQPKEPQLRDTHSLNNLSELGYSPGVDSDWLLDQQERPGRPKTRVDCPYCQSRIQPTSLGFWVGWLRGEAPPYWDDLRKIVLHRDGGQCQRCETTERLHVHHIKPKEEGGTDSSRNLQTLCANCHTQAHLELGVVSNT